MLKKIYKILIPEKFRLELRIALRKLKAARLKGDRFYCPCCGNSSSQFLAKGNGMTSRDHAECAHCGSLERTRLLYLYLKNVTGVFNSSDDILHFAPEHILKQHFRKNPNYIDVDINPNLASVQMDITDIKFPDHQFNLIICSHVLGHIPDEKKAIAEMYRILNPGGTLLLLSLLDQTLETTLEEDQFVLTAQQRLELYGEADLERLYGQDFEERIARSEVDVERIDYRTYFSAAERERMALGDGNREIIYRVTKKGFSS